jgi:hypothetical protein
MQFYSGCPNVWSTVARPHLTLLEIPNVSALRSARLVAPLDGDEMYLRGYSAPGDGGGGKFRWSATSIQADNGGTVIGSAAVPGRWLRLQNGPLNVHWFGAKGDGVADDSHALQAALNAAPIQGFVCGRPGATYGLGAPINLDRPVVLNLAGCVLKPLGPIEACIEVAPRAVLSAPASIRNVKIDGNGRRAANGIRISGSYSFSVSDCDIRDCEVGLCVNGDADLSFTNLHINNVYTRDCMCGFSVERGRNAHSFAQFLFTSCGSEEDLIGLRIKDTTGVIWIGGEIQPKNTLTVDAILCDHSKIQLIGAYLEIYTGTGYTLRAIHGSRVTVSGGRIYGFMVDDTSTVSYDGDPMPNALGSALEPALTGNIVDATGWGPPYWPRKGLSGAIVQKGYKFTDGQGVVWTCTSVDENGPRFAALGGRIVVPIIAGKYANGDVVWFPEEDFVVTHVSLAITETWKGGQVHRTFPVN